MEQYLDHARKIITEAYYKKNRTGIDTISCFGHQAEYELDKGFPLLTTKKLNTKSIIHELLWFIKGDTNIKYLIDNNVHIWDEWAYARYLDAKNERVSPYSNEWKTGIEQYIEKIKTDEVFAKEHGELGPVYGRQWRKWETPEGVIDQFGATIERLKKSPDSRRHIITAWNPAEVDKMALPPCHMFYQLNVRDGLLDLQLYQRSADMFLGVPFNIASYALLTHIIAQETGLLPGRFIHTFGDAHFYCGSGDRGLFYAHHLPEVQERVRAVRSREEYLGVREWILATAPPESTHHGGEDQVPLILLQMSRTPKPLAKLALQKKPYEQLAFEDIAITGYDPHPHIKGKVAV